MNLQELHRIANSASDSIFAVADFTRFTEHLFSDCTDTVALRNYRAAWFELEIVNATALADWEADGRPKEWLDKWNQVYKAETILVIDHLVEVADEMCHQGIDTANEGRSG
ncbi:hypothetical protein [Caenimonas sp. SL110]|uniref:hypothetical protein n=1 Tax=Caenimonas sp. SL110 TaxID=1450524 RepID=UPI00069E9B7C|nr:hypothetical protein [Caenimonas sp. SL110]